MQLVTKGIYLKDIFIKLLSDTILPKVVYNMTQDPKSETIKLGIL